MRYVPELCVLLKSYILFLRNEICTYFLDIQYLNNREADPVEIDRILEKN